MVDTITIRNFRSFKEVVVDDCRRINVIVGDNGSGKTALLEAIFLAAGVSPEIAIRTRAWRGGEQQQMAGSLEDLSDALWADLFYKFQTGKPAFVKLEGTGGENRSVTVTLNKKGQVRLIPPSRKKPGSAPKRVPIPENTPIQFRWSIQTLGDVIVEPAIVDGKFVMPSTPGEAIKAAFFAANRTAPQNELTNRFSTLSQSFHEMEFIDKISRIFPNLRHLSIEMSAGAPMVFASVEGLPRKIPLGLASGGMNKLVAILLTIITQAGGVVLIDEVENGFYYKHLPLVWETLLDFSRTYDCQLFISTHSAECLNAVAKLAEEIPDDFCMLRAVHSGDGTAVRRFEGRRFADAILGNIEIR